MFGLRKKAPRPGAKGRHQPSLHRQLLLWLVLPQVVLWLAGGLATYKLAAGYVDRGIDASLLQATLALSRQLKPLGTGLLIDFPRAAQNILEADPKDPLLYAVSTPPGQFVLGNNRVPAPPDAAAPVLGQPYFYDGAMPLSNDSGAPLQPVRVAALFLSYGTDDGSRQTLLIQVARSSSNRQELARRILDATLLPLSGLIAAMTMIVWAGIRAGLAPLSRLRRAVEGRAPDDLAPLSLAVAPREIHALGLALNALLASVQANVAGQRRFIADAAHQLRTPLAGLKSQTELALRMAQEPGMHARLELVHRSAVRSSHLVNQLLTLARAEPESAAVWEHSRFDLRRFAAELVAEQVPAALRAGVDLGMDTVDGAIGEPLPVSGNPLLLREALLNLIDNAIRYAGRDAMVSLRVVREDRMARLEVVDNGPGIEPASRARVFERFVRASDAGDGSGLGLAIVKVIVERHGGKVSLEDVEPRGLRAVVRLPLAIEAGAAPISSA